MNFHPYIKQFEVGTTSRITAKNIKNGFSKVVEFDIKNIVHNPSLSYALSPEKDYAVVTIELYGQPYGYYKTEQDTAWQMYTGPFELFVNGMVIAKAINTFGVESDISFINISGVIVSVPIFDNYPGLSPDRSEFTFSITYPETIITKQYRLGSDSWQPYVGPITVFRNMAVYARGANIYDVWSREVSQNITGIVADKPVISHIYNPLAGSATVTIDFGNLVERYYSFDNSAWNTYSGPFDITQDSTIYAKGISAGNETMEAMPVIITNITSLNPPSISGSLANDATMNTITISYPEMALTKQYRINEGAWVTYTGPFVIYENHLISAKGKNFHNIESSVATYQGSGIIISVPEITFVLSSNKESATVTINFGNLINHQYNIDNASWSPYTGPFVITRNSVIYARGNNVGNTMTSGSNKSIEALVTIQWEAISANTTEIHSIEYAPELNLYVGISKGVGNSNLFIHSSPDGVAWTQRYIGSGQYRDGLYHRVAWSPDLSIFTVVTSYNFNGYVGVVNSNNGINWTFNNQALGYMYGQSVGMYSGMTIDAVVYSKELKLFVAAGSYSKVTATLNADQIGFCFSSSADGKYFTRRTELPYMIINASGVWILYADLCWSAEQGRFIGVGSALTTSTPALKWKRSLASSTDGISWGSLTIDADSYVSKAITWIKEAGLFYWTVYDSQQTNVASKLTNIIWSSPTGTTFTKRSVSYDGFFSYAVIAAYRVVKHPARGLYLSIVSDGGFHDFRPANAKNIITFSTNGLDWYFRKMINDASADRTFIDIFYSEQLNTFIAIGKDAIYKAISL